MEARVTPFHCRRSELCALASGHRGVCRDAADAEVPGSALSDPPDDGAVRPEIDLRSRADTSAGERVTAAVVVDLDAETAARSGRTERA
jgi:hypothetical protein